MCALDAKFMRERLWSAFAYVVPLLGGPVTRGYPASASLSPASIFSAASSCIDGITWLHVPTLIPILA